jgi:hypothetical protein
LSEGTEYLIAGSSINTEEVWRTDTCREVDATGIARPYAGRSRRVHDTSASVMTALAGSSSHGAHHLPPDLALATASILERCAAGHTDQQTDLDSILQRLHAPAPTD